jgi:hypothetical protein
VTVLSERHEGFCQAIARGVKPEKAYASQGYTAKGAAQSAWALLNKSEITKRVSEIRTEMQAAINERIISGEVQTSTEVVIANKNQQVRIKGQRWNDLMRVKAERAAFFAGADSNCVSVSGSSREPVSSIKLCQLRD